MRKRRTRTRPDRTPKLARGFRNPSPHLVVAGDNTIGPRPAVGHSPQIAQRVGVPSRPARRKRY
jgi:hypothetical protein